MERVAKGRVKYSKTSCYLCSEWLDDNVVEKHLLHCRQKQIVCPNGCGAIVQQKLLQLHLSTCSAGYGERKPTKTIKNSYERESTASNTMSSMDEASANTVVDDTASVVFGLEKNIREMKVSAAGVKSRMVYLEARLDGLLLACNTLLEVLRKIAAAGGQPPNDANELIAHELKNIKTQLEPLSITASLDNQAGGSQHAPVAVGGAGIPVASSDLEKKVKQLEERVTKYQQDTQRTNQRFDMMENHFKVAYYQAGLASQTGRIIWCINDYSYHLANAKAYNVMMRGPIFSHAQYGYTLQVEVDLNGVGPYRGRNMSAGVLVLSGPYDALLNWPCRFNATFILHDQCADRSTAHNITKPFIVRQRNRQDGCNQYVHVLHETLRCCNYLKNNSLMIEMIVEYQADTSQE
ncbi:TNF receptor-associated factor 3 [Anopheles marshallii]|uniref:TNF receptor-associated factor 3 n=1 Tax=Anopheles marshallii TaxID=1521116 RepID=UPI00237AC242|nr:TNF receptor-associated factor 3 [Anopheles marshallii]